MTAAIKLDYAQWWVRRAVPCASYVLESRTCGRMGSRPTREACEGCADYSPKYKAEVEEELPLILPALLESGKAYLDKNPGDQAALSAVFDLLLALTDMQERHKAGAYLATVPGALDKISRLAVDATLSEASPVELERVGNMTNALFEALRPFDPTRGEAVTALRNALVLIISPAIKVKE